MDVRSGARIRTALWRRTLRNLIDDRLRCRLVEVVNHNIGSTGCKEQRVAMLRRDRVSDLLTVRLGVELTLCPIRLQRQLQRRCGP